MRTRLTVAAMLVTTLAICAPRAMAQTWGFPGLSNDAFAAIAAGVADLLSGLNFDRDLERVALRGPRTMWARNGTALRATGPIQPSARADSPRTNGSACCR